MKRRNSVVMCAVLVTMLGAAACGTAGASQGSGTTAVQTVEAKPEESETEQPIGGDPATWGPEESKTEQPIGGDPATWGPKESSGEQLIGGDPATWGPEETTAAVIGMPNPFVDCATMEEAEKLAGFGLTVPDFDFAVPAEGQTETVIQAMDSRLVQVFYRNGDRELMIRKAAGSGDVSGDYTNYSEQHTVTVDGREVTMKGDSGNISTAVWEENGYSYAVVSRQPLTADTVTGLIAGVR